MIHLTRALVRRWMDALLHIDDTPERTAAAYAVGVFCGFSPFLGLHTVMGVVIAFVLNLNRVAVLIGVYSNLPWIIAAYYAGATALGAVVMRSTLPPDFRARLGDVLDVSIFQAAFWYGVIDLLRPFLWPFMVGSTIGAVLLALLAYLVALAFVRLRRKHRYNKA